MEKVKVWKRLNGKTNVAIGCGYEIASDYPTVINDASVIAYFKAMPDKFRVEDFDAPKKRVKVEAEEKEIAPAPKKRGSKSKRGVMDLWR